MIAFSYFCLDGLGMLALTTLAAFGLVDVRYPHIFLSVSGEMIPRKEAICPCQNCKKRRNGSCSQEMANSMIGCFLF